MKASNPWGLTASEARALDLLIVAVVGGMAGAALLGVGLAFFVTIAAMAVGLLLGLI